MALTKVFMVICLLAVSTRIAAQTFTTNTTPVGLEHNLLFLVDQLPGTTQSNNSGQSFDLSKLFDGSMNVTYTPGAVDPSDPIVIEIENLPNIHTQQGAWIGWSTRGRPAKRFKIEGHNTYENSGSNDFTPLADYQNQDYPVHDSYILKVPNGAYTKLKFTFYEGHHDTGRIGISELFYIHPEATTPYQNLFEAAAANSSEAVWSEINAKASYMGNVGIGTTDPNEMLEIVTAGKSSILKLKGKGPNRVHAGVLLEEYSNEANFKGSGVFMYDHSGDTEWFVGRPYNHDWPNKNSDQFVVYRKDGLTSHNEIASALENSSGPTGTQAMLTILNNGHVGIGTGTPSEQLSVAGTINAEEIVLEDVAVWPDYVFEEDYKLRSLEATEQFIKANKHLPEVPSAAEIAEDGLAIKEMNVLLLQKIEELTLHLIRMEKEIEALKAAQNN